MKKDNIYKFLYAICLLLIAGFFIRLGVDYFNYYPYGSAPFYLYVLIRSIEYLIPCVICFIAARITKKKYSPSNERIEL